jgi:hypothetical protein
MSRLTRRFQHPLSPAMNRSTSWGPWPGAEAHRHGAPGLGVADDRRTQMQNCRARISRRVGATRRLLNNRLSRRMFDLASPGYVRTEAPA